MLHARNYSNRPMLHGAITKIKVARFLWTTVYTVNCAKTYLFRDCDRRSVLPQNGRCRQTEPTSHVSVIALGWIMSSYNTPDSAVTDRKIKLK